VVCFLASRLNLSVTPPYNADFDGDEMNIQWVDLILCGHLLVDMALDVASPSWKKPALS
jgi:hypothetical protein